MIKNSGIGFAMKNGIDELKSLTNNITEFTELNEKITDEETGLQAIQGRL